MCLVCLLMLKLPGDVILLPVFNQFRPGLMIGKANIMFDTLAVQVKHPGIVAGPGVRAGFATDRDVLDYRAYFAG